MKGTALLIKENHTVTVLEDVNHEMYKELANQEEKKAIKIGENEVEFSPVYSVLWCEDAIDWNYGY